jgi:DNA polymerase-3 subunit gamma/tau
MSLVLYRKYRPSDFDQVVGQEHIVRTIRNSIKNGKVAHAYLFSGPRGTGKTSIARILAKTVNCENPKDGAPCNKCQICQDINNGQFLDLMEIDAATHTQVDKMRDIVERINFTPSKGKKKVYIIDEVHMLSRGAFNALLKTLEEPPEHALFILATTEIHKIPATIISRCQRFDFRHLRVEEIKKRLSDIAKAEKIEVEDGVLEYIAITSGGGMRDSESLFGQIISLQDDKIITLKEVQDILSVPEAAVFLDVIKLILDQKYSEAILYVNKVSEDGYDLTQLNKGIVEHLRRILLVKMSPDIKSHFSSQMTKEQIADLEKVADSTTVPRIFKIIGAFIKSQSSIKSSILPQLPLEMAIAEIQISDGISLTEKPNPAYNSKVSPLKKEEAKTEMKQEIQEEEEEQEEPATLEAPEVEAESETVLENSEAMTDAKVELESVRAEWSDIVQDVRKCNNSLVACLKTCQPVAMRDGLVIVACQYPFHKEKLQKPENRQAVEQVTAEALKCSAVRMKFVDLNEAQKMGYEFKEVVIEEKRQAEDLVSSALNMFGGELVA